MLGKIGDKLRNCNPKGSCSLSNYGIMLKNIMESNFVGILVSNNQNVVKYL